MQKPENSSLTINPEAERLRNRITQLQREAARLIVERDYLKTSTAPQIAAEYQCKIGALELRVFQYECDVRAFIRRIEMANAVLNRGEKPSYCEIETTVKNEFAAWQSQIAARLREIEAAKELSELPFLSEAESLEIKNLYRKLAFLLHPDITGISDERREKLWLQASGAYAVGDLTTLCTIRLLLDDAPEEPFAGENKSILESLKNRCTELKQVCEKLPDDIAGIKNSPPYAWHEILDDAARLEKIQNDLREKIEVLSEKRRQLAQHWAEILRFAGDIEEIKIPEEPPEIFTEPKEDLADIIYETDLL